MALGTILAAAGLGTSIASSLFGDDKAKTEQVGTMDPQQRTYYNILLQNALSQLGQLVQTPQGLSFQYNPQQKPVYPYPRVAGLAGLQQQALTGAGQLATQQNQTMQQGGPNYRNALASYQPGKIGNVAKSMPSMPTQGTQPYQFNPMAITGQNLPRPSTGQQTQTRSLNWLTPDNYVDPYQAAANPQLWYGGMPTQQGLTQAVNQTGLWDTSRGPVPQYGYTTPPKKKKKSGLLSAMGKDAYGTFGGNTIASFFAKGGPMPTPRQNQRYVVGEVGPEMHIDQSGRMNMVGEHGPEQFRPNQGGYIVPNHQLPAPMRMGQGPQQRTGKEMKLGNMMRMLPGRAEGGAVGETDPYKYWYDKSNTEYQLPNFQTFSQWNPDLYGEGKQLSNLGSRLSPTGVADWNTWRLGEGKSTAAALFADNPTYLLDYGNLGGDQRRDWSQANWQVNEEGPLGAGWYAPGTQGEWTPGQWQYDIPSGQYYMPAQSNRTQQPFENWTWNDQYGWTPSTFQAPTPYDFSQNQWTMNNAGNWQTPGTGQEEIGDIPMQYNYGTGMWEMAPQTSSYEQAPVSGWRYQTPGEGQAGTAMWTPGDFQFDMAPVAEDPNQSYQSDVTPTTPVNPSSLPQIDWTTNPEQLPTYTQPFEQWLAQNNPQLSQWYNQAMTEGPSYTYNPQDITQTWEQSLYNPTMNKWYQQEVPQLEQYYAQTGNVYGGKRPQEIVQQTANLQTELSGKLSEMQLEGRNREADALENMLNRRQQAANLMSSMTNLPNVVGLGAAQVQQLRDQIDRDRIFAGVDLQQAMTNVDLTRANIADIWQAVESADISNAYQSDREMINNIIQLGYLDQMQGTALGQQLDNIGKALRNMGLVDELGKTERDVVQEVLTSTYEDWYNSLADWQKVNVEQYLAYLLGMNTVENLTYQPGGTDFSGLGAMGALWAGIK